MKKPSVYFSFFVITFIIPSLLTFPAYAWKHKDRSGSALFDVLIEQSQRRDQALDDLNETLWLISEQRHQERVSQEILALRRMQLEREETARRERLYREEEAIRIEKIRTHVHWILNLAKNQDMTSEEKKTMYLERIAEDPEAMTEAMSIIQSAEIFWDSPVQKQGSK